MNSETDYQRPPMTLPPEGGTATRSPFPGWLRNYGSGWLGKVNPREFKAAILNHVADNEIGYHYLRVSEEAYEHVKAPLPWIADEAHVKDVTLEFATLEAQRNALGEVAMTLMYGDQPTPGQIAVLREFEKHHAQPRPTA